MGIYLLKRNSHDFENPDVRVKYAFLYKGQSIADQLFTLLFLGELTGNTVAARRLQPPVLLLGDCNHGTQGGADLLHALLAVSLTCSWPVDPFSCLEWQVLLLVISVFFSYNTHVQALLTMLLVTIGPRLSLPLFVWLDSRSLRFCVVCFAALAAHISVRPYESNMMNWSASCGCSCRRFIRERL